MEEMSEEERKFKGPDFEKRYALAVVYNQVLATIVSLEAIVADLDKVGEGLGIINRALQNCKDAQNILYVKIDNLR